ncbi:hypothetical protein D3C87_1680490 [compost metagenome]
MFHRSHHHVVGAFDVDRIFQIPFFVGDLENIFARIDRGAVDQAIHAPQRIDDLLESTMGGLLA